MISPKQPPWHGESTIKILLICITHYCILSGERLKSINDSNLNPEHGELHLLELVL